MRQAADRTGAEATCPSCWPTKQLSSSIFENNTVILFTSDHGEYGGSHGLRSKGGAAYEESLNVPLYISYPSMRAGTPTGPVELTYMCSSVDILPFLYSLALGNELWRNNSSDMIYHLNQRESILDAIFKYNHGGTLPQRRVSNIPLYNSTGGPDYPEQYQPFIVHTADDYSVADYTPPANNYQPSHIVAFRTLDQTDVNSNSAPFYPANSYGGGKLVTYSFWDTCTEPTAPNMGTGANQQYEFYNYSPHPADGVLPANPQEIGNQYLVSGVVSNQANDYYQNFYNFTSGMNGIDPSAELYALTGAASGGYNTQQVAAAINGAYANYLAYLQGAPSVRGLTGSNGWPLSSNSGCSVDS